MASCARYLSQQCKASTNIEVLTKQIRVMCRRTNSTQTGAVVTKDYPTNSHGSYMETGNAFPNVKPPALANCGIGNTLQFKESMKRNETLVQELNLRIQAVHRGGGEQSVKRHLSRNKLLPRDRINLICDPGTPFLELSSLAGMYSYASKRTDKYDDEDVPSGGIVTGIGVIHSNPCMIVANDATVKGG